jgi:hypothetical protein
MDAAPPKVLQESKHYYVIFKTDVLKNILGASGPECPIMDPARFDKELRTCDCPRLRDIALSLLDRTHHCGSDRPCPVRAYLLPD